MADLTLTQGNDRNFDIAIQLPDKTPLSVLGWEAEFAVCRNIIGEDPVLMWSTLTGAPSGDAAHFDIGVSDPTHVVVKFAAADSRALAPGWYAWDLRLTSPVGDAFTPIAGYLRVQEVQLVE